MPKMKSHSGAKKRFKLTAGGKVKRSCEGHNHILSKKSTARKRRLRAVTYVASTQEKTMKGLIPYMD